MVPGSFTVHPWANAALEEVKMLLDGEKLPELGEVELETIFNELRSEDLQHLGCTRAACSPAVTRKIKSTGDIWGFEFKF